MAKMVMPKPVIVSRERDTFHRTVLTARQWQVLRYRAQGLTQVEVARKLGTSRENVGIIEHHAWLKVESAKATLAALQDLGATREVIVPSGASIYEALSMIFLRADVLGIKLLTPADDLLAAIKSKFKGKIRSHHLTSVVKVEVGIDGTLLFENAD